MKTRDVPRWLVRCAARKAPPSLSARLEEEWLADLAERRSLPARLRFGLGCCWATQVIAHQHGVAHVSAASSAAVGGTIAAAPPHSRPSLRSRRALAMTLIAGLHVALIYVLANGLAHTMTSVIPETMRADVLDEQRPRDEALPPPAPSLSQPRIEFPDKVFTFDDPARDRDPIGDTLTIRPAVPPRGPPAPPQASSRIPGAPGKGFPNTDDYYPPTSRRMGEAGVSTVRVCVDDKGRLTGDPSIEESSGSARLDEGALKLAKAGSGRYRATTEDGKPVSSCYPFRIRFQLRD